MLRKNTLNIELNHKLIKYLYLIDSHISDRGWGILEIDDLRSRKHEIN
jgi:hypothetical protein